MNNIFINLIINTKLPNMGIRGLNNLLVKYDCIKNYDKIPNNIRTIAIDANLYICKYMYSKNTEVLYSILNQVLKFLSSDIKPIYIFDGKPPNEKNITIKKRKQKRKNLEKKLIILKRNLKMQPYNKNIIEKIKHLEKLSKSISTNIVTDVKNLLNVLKIQYFDAIGEADYMCAKLCKFDIVDACLTEDMDFILLGSKIIINFKKKGIVNYFDKKYILKKMNLTEEQFTELCIILGSDYHQFKIKIKPFDIYEKLIKYNDINNWILNEENEYIITYLYNCLNIKIFIKKTFNETYFPSSILKKIQFINIKDIQHFFDNKFDENIFPYHNTKSVKYYVQEINMNNI